MEGNFKVIGTDNRDTIKITKGNVYEFINGLTRWDDGSESCYYHDYKQFKKENPTLPLEEVKEMPSTESISIYTRKNRVVATITKGERKFTQSVSLHKANGSFKTAVKMVIELLMDKFEVREIEAVPAKSSLRIVKQDKYEVGDKVKIVDKWGYGCIQLSSGGMDQYLGKIATVKFVCGDGDVKLDVDGEAWYYNNHMIEGKVIEYTVKEETPLTAINSKVGKNGVEIGDTIKVLGSDHGLNKYTVGGIYNVIDIEHDGYPRVIEGSVFGVVTEDFEILRKATAKDTPSFDWEAFKSGKFAVHCDTEEKAREFLKEAGEHDVRWNSGELASGKFIWIYHEKTCYKVWPEKEQGMLQSRNGDTDLPTILDYTPSKPTVKEVSRKAEVGEWIKITDAMSSGGYYKNGDILKVDNRHSDSALTAEGIKERGILDSEYVVLEGYIQEDKPTVKEVKRPAKVGEWIKVVESNTPKYGSYAPGDIILVTKEHEPGLVVEGYNRGTVCRLMEAEYNVLENYTPDNTPIDSNPEPEQPISSSGMREVTRVANDGEYVKVVKAQNIPKTNDEYEYANGDVLKIIRVIGSHARYADGTAENGYDRVLLHSEYVVLENFDYSVFPKNEPWSKAKVGDKIKVVKVNDYHEPKVSNGDEFIVEGVYEHMIHTSKNSFYDSDTEYIIIEEAPVEPKPEDTEINVGDAVKVIGSGHTCSAYDEFVKSHAKDFYGKYQHGYSPNDGDIGVVVGKGDRNGFNDLAYVVLANNKAFCICKTGIEKVRN